MGSNPGAKIRIVARIKGKDGEFDGVSNFKPWISVSRPDPLPNPNNAKLSRVKISFGSDQTSSSSSSGKQSYEMDECYEQDVNTVEIFDREVKPMIFGLFEGQNSTVFAYGPRGSGKTYTIQGCKENFGLAVLTIDAILPQAEEQGKVITVSVFEVYQDRVSDLLAANRPEVSVFDDGQGKTKLKGLSKVKVDSTSEFQSLFLQAANGRRQSQKTTDPLHRSHIGCIVHVVSPQTEKSKTALVGKINFIDLASYEDSRRKSSDGSNLMEATRINKSLYAVHNVLYALNAKEARVPYRESKITRISQDSLGGNSRILMLTCMNPSFCPETVQTISLASRSCMAGFLASLDLGKSSRSGSKTIGVPSPHVLKSASKINMRSSVMSPKTVKPMSASASGKKQVRSQMHMSMVKSKNVNVEAKARKLFDDANQSKKSQQAAICPDSASATESSAHNEVIYRENEAAFNSCTQPEATCPLSASLVTDSSQRPFEEGQSILSGSSDMDSSMLHSDKDVSPIENNIILGAPLNYQTPPPQGNFLIKDKENKGSFLNHNQSPPLSARIREISNNLKSLCLSTEANLKMTQDSSKLFEHVIHENMDPETPKPQQVVPADDKHVIHAMSEFKTPVEIAVNPWENFHKSGSRVKDSLVNEYLKFLNSASKEELKGLKGIGEKRATYILEMRDESPEPFKQLDDLKEIGLSEKQIKGMMRSVAGGFFT